MVGRAALYLHTLRGLRPVQWLYLPLRRLQARLPPRVHEPEAAPAPRHLRSAVERICGNVTEGVLDRAHRALAGEFRFLGRTVELSSPDWGRRYVSHLWNYNLHYFDYARDLAQAAVATGEPRYALRFLELAQSWVRGTEPGRGDGWEPYPTSLRIVNWIYALVLLEDALPRSPAEELITSLARQAAWLERRLEKHIQANHLQKNYQALALAGFFFNGRDAQRWRRLGVRGSCTAIREQVLADGGHYERSPMYHALAMQDFLEFLALCEAAGEAVPDDVSQRVRTMVEAFGVLCRPSGPIHLFNDAAEGVAPTHPQLDRLARDVIGASIPSPRGPLALPVTGYYGFSTTGGDRLVIDCGPPGPRHQPGHAHCDLLSFELDLAGKPVIVDSGVHGYEGDPFRAYSRSTRAHNTVMVGDREQTEVWGAFRVARMARVLRSEHAVTGSYYRFAGAYAPYFDHRMRHGREVVLGRGILRITDRVTGEHADAARSFLHFHPRFVLDSVDGAVVVLRGDAGEAIRIQWFGVGRVKVGRGAGHPEGWYFSGFGRAVPAPVIMGLATPSQHAFGYEICWD